LVVWGIKELEISSKSEDNANKVGRLPIYLFFIRLKKTKRNISFWLAGWNWTVVEDK
jgi:hypothetical protein